jgi:hypothetical protein
MGIDGDTGGICPKGAEEPAKCRIYSHRLPFRTEASQVDEQLPIGELFEMSVRPVRGEPGLADPARPGQRGDQNGPATGTSGVAKGMGERGLFVGAADEPDWGGG